MVSIIVPIYNAEKYLADCIKSIIAQTYCEIEVILVDDGSTDSSYAIASSYVASDDRVKVFHQDNAGVSAARNLGIAHCTGEFICFIDADDYIEEEFVEELVESIVGYDLTICGYSRIREYQSDYILDKSGALDWDTVYEHVLCTNLLSGGVWNKLFRTSFVKKWKICFDTRISVGEDMIWLITYCIHSKNVCYVNKPLYKYRCNPSSTLQSVYHNTTFNPKLITALDAVDLVGNLLSDSPFSIQRYVAYRKVRSSLWLLYQLMLSSYYESELLHRIRKEIRENLLYYYRVKHYTKLELLAAFGVALSPRMTFWFGKKILSKYGYRFSIYLQ